MSIIQVSVGSCQTQVGHGCEASRGCDRQINYCDLIQIQFNCGICFRNIPIGVNDSAFDNHGHILKEKGEGVIEGWLPGTLVHNCEIVEASIKTVLEGILLDPILVCPIRG